MVPAPLPSLGTLEVLLVSAQGLGKTDCLTKIDPYAILSTCPTQTKKSKVAKGSDPEWNEAFMFDIYYGNEELTITLMDKDTFCTDDFLGEAIISLGPVFDKGKIPPRNYKIMKTNCQSGEVKVGLAFIPCHRQVITPPL